jgi:hypothetical protein
LSGITEYKERVWTNEAKEAQFEQQYVDYARKKLQEIFGFISANCGDQVQL